MMTAISNKNAIANCAGIAIACRNATAKRQATGNEAMDLFFAGLIQRAKYYEELEEQIVADAAAKTSAQTRFETEAEPIQDLFFAGLIQRARYYDAYEKATEKRTFRQTTISGGISLPVNG